MMKLTLYACVNDAQHVRKEWGTGEREIRNALERMLKLVSNDSQTGQTLMFCR
ncbi:hypothetical protein [Prevotella vespertina]|uniref:hypothetical protein n=1 Tax=Prevotella vespertina TaxID=2608404 RepID=UPI0018FE3134|nr:hypothetical protein [Prevotella vespertina]